jgi:hypothetical protein
LNLPARFFSGGISHYFREDVMKTHLSNWVGKLIVVVAMLALAFSALGVTLASATDANLIGYWAMDDGSGATAADSSDYGHPGALTGGSWSTSHAPTNFANTGSLSLDGSSGQGINTAAPVTSATNNLSMSAWVN